MSKGGKLTINKVGNGKIKEREIRDKSEIIEGG